MDLELEGKRKSALLRQSILDSFFDSPFLYQSFYNFN